MDRRFDVCMLISVCSCVCVCVNACVMTQLGVGLSLVVYYGFGELLGIYPITLKGGCSLVTPDANILLLC